MSEPCRPCLALVPPNPCPSDFSGGTAIVPVPTRQRVCNTEQTASCPDGSNVQTVAAGTFCIVVLNPTTASVATTQAALDAQALAQAQSQVGDCAWESMVWSSRVFNEQAPHTNASITAAGNGGEFSANATVPITNPNGGTYGVFLTGDINFTYGPGVVKNHRLSGSFVNLMTGAAFGPGVFQSQIELYAGINFGAMVQIFTDSHSGAGGVGTFPFSFDFTSPGTAPWVFELRASTTVYCPTNTGFNQTLSGTIIALD